MVEVAQVRELVAERVHEARVLERRPVSGVAQPDPDRAVGVADAVAPLHAGALGRDRAVAQPEAARDALRHRALSALESELVRAGAIHRRARMSRHERRGQASDAGRGMPGRARRVRCATWRSPSWLPLFPLSNVVLFPRVQTPAAHLRAALSPDDASTRSPGARAIGMVAVRPEHVDADGRRPAALRDRLRGRIIEASSASPTAATTSCCSARSASASLRESRRADERLYRVAEVERLEDAFEAERARPRGSRCARPRDRARARARAQRMRATRRSPRSCFASSTTRPS